jgi:hypothetical protein
VKIEAWGFVVEKYYGAQLDRYTVSIVCDVAPVGIKAAINGEVPLLVFNGSEIAQNLTRALHERKLVKVTVEV